MMRFSQLSYMRCRCHFWLCTPTAGVYSQRLQLREDLGKALY